MVLEYAVKYFGLSTKHNAVVADAVSYAAKVVNDTNQRYDYIIHDVFTGGAEPVDLFTDEFLRNLHGALKPNGVIAIVSFQIRLFHHSKLTCPELCFGPPPAHNSPRHPHYTLYLPHVPHLPRSPASFPRRARGCRLGLRQHGRVLPCQVFDPPDFPSAGGE